MDGAVVSLRALAGDAMRRRGGGVPPAGERRRGPQAQGGTHAALRGRARLQAARAGLGVQPAAPGLQPARGCAHAHALLPRALRSAAAEPTAAVPRPGPQARTQGGGKGRARTGREKGAASCACVHVCACFQPRVHAVWCASISDTQKASLRGTLLPFSSCSEPCLLRRPWRRPRLGAKHASARAVPRRAFWEAHRDEECVLESLPLDARGSWERVLCHSAFRCLLRGNGVGEQPPSWLPRLGHPPPPQPQHTIPRVLEYSPGCPFCSC